MNEFPERLLAFLARSDEPEFNLRRKLDLLTQAVSNLIDEVTILRRFVQDRGGLSPEQWQDYYRNEKMKLLYSSSGLAPPPLSKYEAFLRDEYQTATALIPDPDEREKTIDELGSLT